MSPYTRILRAIKGTAVSRGSIEYLHYRKGIHVTTFQNGHKSGPIGIIFDRVLHYTETRQLIKIVQNFVTCRIKTKKKRRTDGQA